MPADTFTLVIDVNELVGGAASSKGRLTIRYQGTAQYAIFDGDDLRALDAFSGKGNGHVPPSVSSGYTVDLPTDVASGGDHETSLVGYDVMWRSEHATVRATFKARPAGSTWKISQLTNPETIPVAESAANADRARAAANEAEADADRAETAADTAEQVSGLTGEDDAVALLLSTDSESGAAADARVVALDADADSALRQQTDARYSPRARVEELTVNVKAFGAVGDWNGSTGTDNLAAFIAAHNALPAGGGRIYVPAGRYRLSNGWMLTRDKITVECHDAAEVLTTQATSPYGCTASFMGGNGIQTPNNAVDTPQSTRAAWVGGRISATGSGTADNALGFVRYKNTYAADVRLDADRKAITAQYGVENIVWERFVVERAGTSAVTIETSCLDAEVRDFDVLQTDEHGIHVMSVDGTNRRNKRVRFRRGRIRSAGGWGILAGATDVLEVAKLRVDAAASGAASYTDCAEVETDLSGTWTTSNSSWATNRWVTVALQNSWTLSGTETPAVLRDPFGRVQMRGKIQSGTTTAGTVLCTLPAGYRPPTTRDFHPLCVNSSGDPVLTRLLVNSSGQVILQRGGSNFYLALDQVGFYAS